MVASQLVGHRAFTSRRKIANQTPSAVGRPWSPSEHLLGFCWATLLGSTLPTMTTMRILTRARCSIGKTLKVLGVKDVPEFGFAVRR